MDNIQHMTRQDWNELNEVQKAAAYRAFTSEQRVRFWHDKLEEVKMLDWTEEEFRHICLVDSFIDAHTDLLSGKKLTDNQLNTLEVFFYLWEKNAEKKFGWSPRIAISIAGSGNTLIDTKGNVAIKGKELLETRGSCNCNTFVLSDFCMYDGHCKSTMCDEMLGCGWLLIQSCNGECSGID